MASASRGRTWLTPLPTYYSRGRSVVISPLVHRCGRLGAGQNMERGAFPGQAVRRGSRNGRRPFIMSRNIPPSSRQPGRTGYETWFTSAAPFQLNAPRIAFCFSLPPCASRPKFPDLHELDPTRSRSARSFAEEIPAAKEISPELLSPFPVFLRHGPYSSTAIGPEKIARNESGGPCFRPITTGYALSLGGQSS